MIDLTVHAAERVEDLLEHLLVPPLMSSGDGSSGGLNASSSSSSSSVQLPRPTPEQDVQVYKVAMSDWSNAYHSTAGDQCEGILEQYNVLGGI
jgi:hypothetical protein